MEVAANPLVSSSETCMRLIRQAARALYNDSYPNGMAHLCRLPTQIPMKWWPRETLKAGEVVHILGELGPFQMGWGLEPWAGYQWADSVHSGVCGKRLRARIGLEFM